MGVEDWQRRLFDSLIPLHYGTSYNAYLVRGKEKAALIDTVESHFTEELFAKISAVVELERRDYLIMNHAEPDHAGNISRVMEAAPNAKLVATKKVGRHKHHYLNPVPIRQVHDRWISKYREPAHRAHYWPV